MTTKWLLLVLVTI